ncbi:hypothetical protein [Sphingobium sp. LSP13-1-1.1]|uniref:hypothetical protein n=1 Tax=Sphingobium sp. LSP13-1-1.1 TaxID=3135234 RepID=UPI0034254795
MALDYHLDYSVRYSDDSEFKNLYKWSLQEIDEDGKKVGRDLIPWDWSLNFTATEFTHSHSTLLGERHWRGNDEPPEQPSQFIEREFIRAELRPGYHNEDPRWAPSYSMLGTKRHVTSFGLYIQCSDDEKETCRVWGSLSYTMEIDFRDETPDDSLQVYMTVSKARFDRLVERIKSRDFDIATVRIGGVDGFYSDWSPSISTDSVKILSSAKDHKVQLPEGLDIKLPQLGNVNEFDLTLLSRRKTEIAQPQAEPDVDAPDDDYQAFDPEAHQRNQSDLLIKQVTALGEKVKKSQTVLWVIAGLLVALLLK